jgi:hypothetical protein
MVAGHPQTIIEYFRLSSIYGEAAPVLVPIGGKLNRALSRFGDTLLIVENGGSTAILGKTWANTRVTNYWLRQYLLNVMFSSIPEVFGGNIIKDAKRNKHYFVYNLHKITIREDVLEQKGTLLYINKACEIQRLNGATGSFGGTKQEFGSQATDIRCHLKEITADLRTERPALLERADFLLYMQNSQDLQVLDRIAIDTINYQVEHIDRITCQGLHEAQLSLDKR